MVPTFRKFSESVKPNWRGDRHEGEKGPRLVVSIVQGHLIEEFVRLVKWQVVNGKEVIMDEGGRGEFNVVVVDYISEEPRDRREVGNVSPVELDLYPRGIRERRRYG